MKTRGGKPPRRLLASGRRLVISGWLGLAPAGAAPPVAAPPPGTEAKREVLGRAAQWRYVIDEEHYFWYLWPDTFYVDHGVRYETNSLGLRDAEFPVAKPPGTLRIVCLGDSVTYGSGVSGEHTYERQLEKMLRARGRQVQVINAGIGSQRAWQGVARLEHDVVRFDPDIVAISFGANDGSLSPQTLWQEWRDRLAERNAPGGSGIPARPEADRPRAGLAPNVPIDEYAEHLEALVTSVRRRTGAGVYLIVFSSCGDDYNRSTWTDELRERQRSVYRRYQERVREVGRRTGATVVEVAREFDRSSRPPFGPDGIHPNAWGYHLYAESLFRAMAADPRLGPAALNRDLSRPGDRAAARESRRE